MKPDLERLDDDLMRDAKRAYRAIGPSEAQLARMLDALGSAPAPHVSRFPKGKIWKLSLSTFAALTLGLLA